MAESLLRSAIVSLERGDHEGAERALRQGLTRVPEHPGCLATLALCLAEGQRRYVTAERLAARAIKVAPGEASGYHALGRIYLLGGRKQQAFRFLMKAFTLSPGDPRVSNELQVMGRRRPPVFRALPRGHPLNMACGRWRAFLADGRHAALVATLILVTLVSVVTAAFSAPDPRTEAAAVSEGLARVDSLLAAGAAAVAVREADALLVRAGPFADLAWQLQERRGLALHRLGRYEEAVAAYERGLRSAPQAATLHLNLASALMALGERGRAFAEFEAAAALDPAAWRARVDYGQALAGYGQTAAARRELTEGFRLCDGCAGAARALGAFELEAGDFAAALAPLTKAWAAAPDPALRRALALARLRTGDARGAADLLAPLWPEAAGREEGRLLIEADRALRDPARALSLVAALPEGPVAGAAAAPGAQIAGETAAGASSAEQRAALAAGAELWGAVAVVLIEAGRDPEGLRAVERAIALAGGQAVYRHNRALLLDRLGRPEEAQAELRRADALAAPRTDKPR
ncbi:MAG: tetratricopeptide repeat protein [Candidatus Krumholzibacteriia bacterium]